MLRELHVTNLVTPTIYSDNVGATYVCHNPVFHNRMKHISVDFHFVRDQVQKDQVQKKQVHIVVHVADQL